MKMKIKKGDTVRILSGKERWKTGKVLRALPREERVVVEGVNVVKEHRKRRGKEKQGQIVEKPLPVHVSVVALIDPKTGKPSRIGTKIVGDKKVRISKKSGMEF